MTTPNQTSPSPTSSDAADDVATVRRSVSDLADARARWESEATEQQGAAEALAAGLRGLAAELRQAKATHEAMTRTAEAALGERRRLEERLRQAERASDEARCAAEARERRAVEEQRRADDLVAATRRFHGLDDAGSLFDNILDASVKLASTKKGACLRPTAPHEVLAAVAFDELRPASPLLGAVARRVAEEQEPLVLNDAGAVAALADDPSAPPLRNLIGYPIVTGEQLAGIVIVADRRDGAFTEADARMLLGIGGHAAVALENGRLRREADRTYAATVALLCDVIEAKDPSTHGHCEEVAALAMAIAGDLGYAAEDQQAVYQASLLHDVGKVAVSDGVLLKPGALRPAERKLIESHVVVGAELVQRVPNLRHLAPIVRHHHERYDGAGYPDGLAGDAIPPLARILSAADAYQAMRADRPYRPALGPEEARAELLRHRGGQFDPEVVDALLRVLDAPGALERARRTAVAVPSAQDG